MENSDKLQLNKIIIIDFKLIITFVILVITRVWPSSCLICIYLLQWMTDAVKQSLILASA